jgi:NodT family efflux transporter outer membrane factor (OMF) lipoprotein
VFFEIFFQIIVLMGRAVTSQQQILHEIIITDRHNLQLIKTALHNGAATKLEVIKLQQQLILDQTLLPVFQQQASAANNALAILLGKLPNQWQAPSITLKDFSLPQALPISLPSELAHQRPDILAAEEQLHAANASIGIASAQMYPNISLSANFTQQSLSPETLFNSASGAWGVASNLLQPIFNAGKLTANKNALIQAHQATLALYQQTVLHAFQQVADAIENVTNTTQILNSKQAAYILAKKTLTLAHLNHDAGNSNLLQVFESKRMHANAQLEMYRAQLQSYLDATKLFIALGGSPTTYSAK